MQSTNDISVVHTSTHTIVNILWCVLMSLFLFPAYPPPLFFYRIELFVGDERIFFPEVLRAQYYIMKKRMTLTRSLKQLKESLNYLHWNFVVEMPHPYSWNNHSLKDNSCLSAEHNALYVITTQEMFLELSNQVL